MQHFFLGIRAAIAHFYFSSDTKRRLCDTDATYVDVIHTDSGILGFPKSVGHADFYPNGGKAMQPGCSTTYTVDLAGYCKFFWWYCRVADTQFLFFSCL